MKKDRKKEIIQTAAKLFRRKGYNAVSMRDLAQELGIKAASLYNHISSKQEILALIIINIAESFMVHITEVLPKDTNSIEKLEEIIQMHIEITVQKTDFLACMNNDWMHLDEGNRANYVDMRNNYEAKFREILQEGMAKNELEKRDPEIVLFALLSTLRTLYLWYSKNKEFDESLLKKDQVGS